ncbi:MAG TPA: LytTR family DNA-binding domain-containing protein [Brumimicrobium sp.]|nr:LytTR family DNA-binding domain-containing protein [Brumimicrobium sp.]
MYNVLVIDDVKELSDALVSLLNSFCGKYISSIEVSNTYNDASKLLDEKEYDVIFLDIELDNGKSGFDLLKDKTKQNPHLVITTSHANYALNAIKSSAIDFLLKPIDPTELIFAFEKIEEQERSKSIFNLKLKALQENLLPSNARKKLVLKSHESVNIVNVNEIVRCQAEVNYTVFYLVSSERIVVSKSLKEYDELLSESGFFRVHKSHLVNLEYIKSFQKREGGYLLMKDGESIPVSVRKRETLFTIIENM